VIGCPIRDEYVDCQYQSGEARKQTQDQKNSTDGFYDQNKLCHKRGRWEIEAGKELCNLAKIVKLTPSRLRELPTPIKTDREEKWRLDEGHSPAELLVVAEHLGALILEDRRPTPRAFDRWNKAG
jgi:hypothetical protein